MKLKVHGLKSVEIQKYVNTFIEIKEQKTDPHVWVGPGTGWTALLQARTADGAASASGIMEGAE